MSDSVKGNIFVTETAAPKNDWRSKVFQVALKGYFKEGLEFSVNWLIKHFQHLDHTAVQTSFDEFQNMYLLLNRAEELDSGEFKIAMNRSEMLVLSIICIWFCRECSSGEVENLEFDPFEICEKVAEYCYDNDY